MTLRAARKNFIIHRVYRSIAKVCVYVKFKQVRYTHTHSHALPNWMNSILKSIKKLLSISWYAIGFRNFVATRKNSMIKIWILHMEKWMWFSLFGNSLSMHEFLKMLDNSFQINPGSMLSYVCAHRRSHTELSIFKLIKTLFPSLSET